MLGPAVEFQENNRAIWMRVLGSQSLAHRCLSMSISWCWGDGSVGRVFTLQAWGPDCHPPNLGYKFLKSTTIPWVYSVLGCWHRQVDPWHSGASSSSQNDQWKRARHLVSYKQGGEQLRNHIDFRHSHPTRVHPLPKEKKKRKKTKTYHVMMLADNES